MIPSEIWKNGQYKMYTTDCRLGLNCILCTKCRLQTADCRLGLKCKLKLKLSHRLIRNIFSMYDLWVIIRQQTEGML